MLAITNGKVITVTKGIIEKGTVLVDNGKITAVGAKVKIPKGAEVIDAEGGYITPGFIDCHSHIGVMGEPNVLPHQPGDGNEMSDPITPHVRARDGMNTKEFSIAKVREAGFTTASVLPGSANVIGGEGIAVKLIDGTIDDMIIPDTAQMKMALGENPRRVYGSDKKMPMTRMGNAALMRKALYDAKNYADKIDAAKDDPSKLPAPDFKLDALIDVVRGKKRARIHCHRADDIATAIRIAQEFELDFTLEHATEGYLVKEKLADNNVTCIIGPMLVGPVKQELWNIDLDNAKKLNEAGVKICLTEDASHETMWLPMHIGILIKRGLPEDVAYKAVTINPAEVLGIADRVGSIEVGKDADIAVFDGNPFCNLTSCKATVIDGVVYKN